MLSIKADILINDQPYSVTREAFAQFRELKNKGRAKPFTDSILLDKLRSILASARVDYSAAPKNYDIGNGSVPLFRWIAKNGEYYQLSVVAAKHPTLVGVEKLEPNDAQENPLVHEIDVNGIVVGITDHALQRFAQRWLEYEQELPADLLKTLAKMLRYAEADELDPFHRVIRLINNGIQRADYLRHGPWRMVLIDDNVGNTQKALVTFERRLQP